MIGVGKKTHVALRTTSSFSVQGERSYKWRILFMFRPSPNGPRISKTTQNTPIAAAQFLKTIDKPTLFISQDKPVPETATPNSKFWFRDRLIETFIEKLELRRGAGLVNFRYLAGKFEMVEDLLDDLGVFNDRDDAYSTTARTFEDIDVVDAFE